MGQEKAKSSQAGDPTIGPGYDALGTYVPRGFTRRVGIALAGSSGQGCLG
jgi:hypothetical protein